MAQAEKGGIEVLINKGFVYEFATIGSITSLKVVMNDLCK